MCSPYAEESGVRTFTGSRSASVDATFSDHADDCTDNGFPRPQGYVMNLTAIAAKEPPIDDFLQYVNFSGMAEGLVGMEHANPNLIFYFPILPQVISPDLTHIPSCRAISHHISCIPAISAHTHISSAQSILTSSSASLQKSLKGRVGDTPRYRLKLT